MSGVDEEHCRRDSMKMAGQCLNYPLYTVSLKDNLDNHSQPDCPSTFRDSMETENALVLRRQYRGHDGSSDDTR